MYLYHRIGHIVLKEKICKFPECFFLHLLIFSLWKKICHLNMNRLKSSLLKAVLLFKQSLVELAQWFQRTRLINFCISYIPRLGKGRCPSSVQIWIPFTQGCFVLSLAEQESLVLEKKIFTMCYLILEKWRGPSFEQAFMPFTQDWFGLSLVEIGKLVLEKTIF